jgi:hypothetical protein
MKSTRHPVFSFKGRMLPRKALRFPHARALKTGSRVKDVLKGNRRPQTPALEFSVVSVLSKVGPGRSRGHRVLYTSLAITFSGNTLGQAIQRFCQ